MCLAVPMKVTKIEQSVATVEMQGVQTRVGMQLLDDVAIGDYVLVHAGYAIEKLNLELALETLRYFEEIAEKNAESADDS
jgi:hydrogenase expression/formation protein HypC